MLRDCSAGVRALLLGTALVALATAGEARAEGDGHQHVLGVKGGFLAGFGSGQDLGLGGGGLFLESMVLENWLEVEVSLRILGTQGHAVVPVDVLLKMPFHLDEMIHPYLGLGPTLVAVIDDGTNMHFGLVVVGGTYMWATDWWGVLAEVSYGIIDEHGPRHEVGINLGLAFRW